MLKSNEFYTSEILHGILLLRLCGFWRKLDFSTKYPFVKAIKWVSVYLGIPVFYEEAPSCISRIIILLLLVKFIPQWAWVLSNLWYVHSPTRRHVIKIINVIFTVKTMMWMFTHEPAPLWTLHVWEHLLTLLSSYSMFGLLKGSMRFGDSVFWRMVFEMFGHGLLLFWWLQR